ncbi:MAG: glycosyltransferase family 61 protein [Deltaproteobacteria bacterium]|nr:glycosyltransferase family 61 protein [Deltaproteobacteria bacterium]
MRLPARDRRYRYILVEAAKPLSTPVPAVNLGSTITRLGSQSKLAIPESTFELGIVQVKQGVFDIASCLIFAHGKVTPWSRYLVSEDTYRKTALVADCDLLHSENGVAIGFNRNWRNYYHWMLQCLPAVYSYMLHIRKQPIILLPKNLDLLRCTSLALLGLEQKSIIYAAAQQINIKALYTSSYLLGDAVFTPSRLTREVFDQIKRRCLPDSITHRGGRIIYISRQDSPNRPITNEKQLIDTLERSGVECVVTSEMTLHDQVALFDSASIVIGGHGAGLTNIGFCRPGAVLYELHPSHYINKCFEMIAISCGVEYWADVFPAEPEELKGRHRTNWTVDIGVVLDRLSEIKGSREPESVN